MANSLFRSSLNLFLFSLLTATTLIPLVSAVKRIESKSLNPCQANTKFSASLFDVVFTPDNNTLTFDIDGVSDIDGNVTAMIEVFAYGFKAFEENIDACDLGDDVQGLCPMQRGQITIHSNVMLGDDVIGQVPGIAYTVPDLDGTVRVYINDSETGDSLACVEAELSNGKTVNQKGVAWTVAVIAGLALVASAVTSGLGHSNTSAHVAANAMSLFGFFQAQAIMGMTSISLPPIVAAWTQNFQWSMGIIRVSFLQEFSTWYQRSTGGVPTQLLQSLETVSVRVQKRSLEVLGSAVNTLLRRTNNQDLQASSGREAISVRGIERVGFRAGIEISNIFMTGYTFFIIFVIVIVMGVLIFKGVCEALAKAGRLKGEKFQDFRSGWTTILKGILFRIILIGYTQMCVLCFWELTRRDSPAEVVLAVFTILTMLAILGWASSKVIRIARKSIQLHKNPAYILYSDPVSLNKWGFLYVQFKATAYYFIVPILAYLLVKGLFVGLAQESPVTQAVALILLEAGLLVGVSILRPYMDKKTNAFNISIAAINFISSIFLLFFTEVFNLPGLVTGVMGWVFFLLNAIFATILLIMVLIASVYAIISKNPDARYQPMRDDRGSFIKSQTQLTGELDALGATARGDGVTAYKGRNIDDDDDSFSSGSLAHQEKAAAGRPMSNLSVPSSRQLDGQPPRSPGDLSAPLFGSDGSATGRPNQPPMYPIGGYASTFGKPSSLRGDSYRTQNNSSPWQRGAGYE